MDGLSIFHKIDRSLRGGLLRFSRSKERLEVYFVVLFLFFNKI